MGHTEQVVQELAQCLVTAMCISGLPLSEPHTAVLFDQHVRRSEQAGVREQLIGSCKHRVACALAGQRCEALRRCDHHLD
jgi:hypothetical protein